MPHTTKELRRYLDILKGMASLDLAAHAISLLGHGVFESVLWRTQMNMGRDVRVHPLSSIRNPANVYVGDKSHINLFCCVWAGETSKVIIGRDVLMGPGVQLHASKHGMDLSEPMIDQRRVFADVVIGDDVWLCAGAVVTAGTKIAKGVVVASNAVVTRDIVDEDVVVGGVPARVLHRRTLPTRSTTPALGSAINRSYATDRHEVAVAGYETGDE